MMGSRVGDEEVGSLVFKWEIVEDLEPKYEEPEKQLVKYVAVIFQFSISVGFVNFQFPILVGFNFGIDYVISFAEC